MPEIFYTKCCFGRKTEILAQAQTLGKSASISTNLTYHEEMKTTRTRITSVARQMFTKEKGKYCVQTECTKYFASDVSLLISQTLMYRQE